ncbi:MAG: hypothetical protein M1831_003561 [Alyxoria varia]|nr:MAG: hypothetical protein M1831_003561 [Alyxoria varia]
MTAGLMDATSSDHHNGSTNSNHTTSPSPGSPGSRQTSTIRIKDARHASGSSNKQSQTTPISDDQSLTSFPSLSPSLANSPEHTTPHLLRTSRLDHYTQPPSPTPESAAPKSYRGLFTPVSPEKGQTALFEETSRGSKGVPGTVHLQSDKHVEHLVSRMGAVTLIRQLAEDLAQRDAQVTRLQRKADERETLLKRMLRDCKVSNFEIERQLKELEASSNKGLQSLDASVGSLGTGGQFDPPGHRGKKNIDDQVSEAFEDVMGGEEATNGEAAYRTVRRMGSTLIAPPSRSVSTASRSAILQSVAQKEPAHGSNTTIKGWKDYFKGGRGTSKYSQASKNTITSTNQTAQERLGAIHSATANRGTATRKGLSSDLFQPPPSEEHEEERQSDIRRNGALEGDTASVKSNSSVASWALKLVAGRPSSDGPARDSNTTKKKSPPDDDRSSERATSGKQPSQSRVESPSARSIPAATGPTATVKKSTTNKTSQSGPSTLIPPGSPHGATAPGTTKFGPVELEDFLPDEARPPTLAPYDNSGGTSDLLTDRFGFIYDQRRKKRQSEAAETIRTKKPGSRVETLESATRSLNSFAAEDDVLSIDSQTAGGHTDSQPPVVGSVNDSEQVPQTRRWQDYLKLSNISSTELLSHTPSPAPLTTIVNVDTQTESEPASPPGMLSRQGTGVSLSSNPVASSTPAVSDNAELAQMSNADKSPLGTSLEQPQAMEPVKALLDQLTELHDSLQKEREAKWNEFLRRNDADRDRDRDTAPNQHRRTNTITMATDTPEATLTIGEFVGVSGLGNKGKVGRAKWNEFRNLVLGGIPVSYRAKIWAECSGAMNLRVPGYYRDLVSSSDSVDKETAQQIQMDIPRTLTDNVFFRAGRPGAQKLQEVLLAYACRNREIGYCQGMNLIAANLLLVMPTAEDAFWLLASLIENILPDKYYDHSLLTSRADQIVLRQYVATLLPGLSTHLEALGVELEALSFQWFLSVFTDCLSAEALFRVWDVVLCLGAGDNSSSTLASSGGGTGTAPAGSGSIASSITGTTSPSDSSTAHTNQSQNATNPTTGGATFLFQVSLALLKLNEKDMLACSTPAEVYAYISRQMTDHAISIDGLIRASEGLRRVVKKEEVVERRAKVVKEELERGRLREEERKRRVAAVDAVKETTVGNADVAVMEPEAGHEGNGAVNEVVFNDRRASSVSSSTAESHSSQDQLPPQAPPPQANEHEFMHPYRDTTSAEDGEKEEEFPLHGEQSGLEMTVPMPVDEEVG